MEGFVSFIVAICMIWPVISFIYRIVKASKREYQYQRAVNDFVDSTSELVGEFAKAALSYNENKQRDNDALDFNDGKPFVVELTVKVIPALLAYICKSSGYDKDELKENEEKFVNDVLNDEMYNVLKDYELNSSFIRNNVNSVIDAVYNNEITDNLLKKRIIEFFSLPDENQEDKIRKLNLFLSAICPFELSLNDDFKFYLYGFFEEYGLKEEEIREILLEFGIGASEEDDENENENKREYYLGILGLDANASVNEIKKAYHDLAMKFHSDRLESYKLDKEFIDFANQRFTQIQEAYDYLMADGWPLYAADRVVCGEDECS